MTEAARGRPAHRRDLWLLPLIHLNPCGAAQDTDVLKAVDKALKADPKSVFGGIVAVTSEVNKEAAELLAGLFLECVVAPSFSLEALKVFETKKNLRVLEWPEMCETSNAWDATDDGARTVR